MFRSVVFDWDGTLVDSAEASYRCFVKTFDHYGIPFSRETYSSTYSPNWYHVYRCIGLPDECWPEADAKWLDLFSSEAPALIPGAVETLRVLAERNVICALVTNGTRHRIDRELVALGVDHHFAHVSCGDDGHRRKPDPESLLTCLAKLGVDPSEAVYIGDSAEDVMMSRAAGVFAIGVRGTYPNHDALIASSPDLFAESLADALRAIR